MSNQTAITQGAHHIGLTVPNLDVTRNFFTDTLGYQQVGEVPDYPAAFLSDGHTMITLWQAKQPETATAFDRHNQIGLHHFALAVANSTQLQELHQQLADHADVVIEFAPEPLGSSPTQHMICTIPGGIRVEFIATS